MTTDHSRAPYESPSPSAMSAGNVRVAGAVNTLSAHGAEAIRRPIFYFAKFGTGVTSNWALDVFSLPHNAIRAECVDLYNILESIHARSHQVCVLELEEFFSWWKTFESFIIEYFDFEADVLFPWVFPVAANTSHLNPIALCDIPAVAARKVNADAALRSSLLARKDGLLDSIRQLNGTFELRRHVDTTDVFQTIVDEVNSFVPKLLEYFHIEERHLPTIAQELYAASARDILGKKYVGYIKRGESPQMNLVLLSRWMDSDVRDKWIRTNVKGYWRLMHRRLERRCFRAHGVIAVKFGKRLQRSVRSVAASRLRRRTEFGEEMDDISFGSLPSYGGSVRSLSVAMSAPNYSTSNLRAARSDSQSAAQLQRSGVGPQRNGVGPQRSGVGPQRSGVGPQRSSGGPQRSGVVAFHNEGHSYPTLVVQ